MMKTVRKKDISEMIEASRDRCASRHHLRETTTHPIMRLQGSELAPRREAFLEKVGGPVPEIENLLNVTDTSKSCLLISDAERFVVGCSIPPGCEQYFYRRGIALGGLWEEKLAGTNGIDMSIRARASLTITITGDEHYYRCFRELACSSAPLFDASQKVIGCLTLVTPGGDGFGLCEHLLRVSSIQLQTRLFRSSHASRVTARLISLTETGANYFETLAAFGDNGRIIATLNLTPELNTPAAHQSLVGTHFEDLSELAIDVQGPVREFLPGKRPTGVPQSGARRGVRRSRSGSGSRALRQLAKQGGGLEQLIDRARKLLVRNVPVTLTGEAGIGKTRLGRLLLEDLGLGPELTFSLDCGRPHDFRQSLDQIRFFWEHPVDDCLPAIFLRNVHVLPPELQSELAAFLSDLERMGGHDGSFAAPATVFSINGEWEKLRLAGAMEERLVYLIAQALVEVPPLRARRIPTVLEEVLADLSPEPVEISPEAEALLVSNPWPGNILELRAVLREALACGNGRRITLPDLPPRIAGRLLDGSPRSRQVALREALSSSEWNVSKAAKLLGISRATANRWIAAEGLMRPR